MSTLKKVWVYFAAGLGVGVVLAAWFSPGLIEWYYTPPVEMAVSCKGAVSWSISAYRSSILVGGLLFSILCGSFGIYRQFKNKNT